MLIRSMILLLITCVAVSARAQSVNCSALASKSFGADIKIESATVVAATQQAPEHCDVRGVIAPEAKFAVKLRAGLAFGETFMRFMVRPPLGADWNYKAFNFDRDYAKLADISKMIDATDPDLSKLKKRGGKIIQYHGWADALVNPQASVDYYESVLKKLGNKQTKEFYKLYMVPGMFHCAGGVGCDRADWFAPLVEWVEKGVVPNVLAGSRVVNGATVLTRPHCAYPAVAKYKGSGDSNKAENFICTEGK